MSEHPELEPHQQRYVVYTNKGPELSFASKDELTDWMQSDNARPILLIRYHLRDESGVRQIVRHPDGTLVGDDGVQVCISTVGKNALDVLEYAIARRRENALRSSREEGDSSTPKP